MAEAAGLQLREVVHAQVSAWGGDRAGSGRRVPAPRQSAGRGGPPAARAGRSGPGGRPPRGLCHPRSRPPARTWALALTRALTEAELPAREGPTEGPTELQDGRRGATGRTQAPLHPRGNRGTNSLPSRPPGRAPTVPMHGLDTLLAQSRGRHCPLRPRPVSALLAAPLRLQREEGAASGHVTEGARSRGAGQTPAPPGHLGARAGFCVAPGRRTVHHTLPLAAADTGRPAAPPRGG